MDSLIKPAKRSEPGHKIRNFPHGTSNAQLLSIVYVF